jgi:hypothetical protein
MARRIWIVCLSLACTGVALPALAQDGLLEDLYGRGVHAYFEHRYEEAHGLLTKAITSGLKDPRAFYFRGLTNLRLGRPDEAKVEFATGADYEAIAAEPVNVGKALERVQGADRLTIEQHRRAGRLALHNKAAAAAKARYEERIKAEERVLLPGRGAAASRSAPVADESDPFDEGAAKPAPLPAVEEPKPVPPADAPPAEPKPVEPAEPKPAAVKPAEPKPAASDPFAEEPKPATPAPAVPKPAEPATEEAKLAEPAAAAEAPRGSLLSSLFRATAAGAAKGLAGDDANAPAKPAPAPAAVPDAANPFGEKK